MKTALAAVAFSLVSSFALAQALPPAAATSTAVGFVPMAANSDMYEVAAGRLALQRSQNASVRNFAQQMVTAHTKTTADLKAAITDAKLSIAPPAKMDADHQALMDKLNAASAGDFDKTYIQQQVTAHQQALDLMTGFAKNGDVETIKKFATSTAPAVQMHLNMARQMNGQGPTNNAGANNAANTPPGGAMGNSMSRPSGSMSGQTVPTPGRAGK